MTVFYQRVGAITGGVVASTFGTAVSTTLRTQARGLLGLAIMGVDATVTAAEGKCSLVRLNSKSLDLKNEVFISGPYVTSAPATHESGHFCIPEIIPLDIECNGGESISIDCAPAGASTAGIVYEASLIYYDQKPPMAWLQRFPDVMPFRGADAKDAQQLTTTRTALTAIEVPGYCGRGGRHKTVIVGVKGVVLKTGAITAGEEGLGYFELESTIPNSNPMEVITAGYSASLGTPVGTGVHFGKFPYMPAYIEVGGKDQTVTPNIHLRTAVTTDNRVALGLAWR